MIKRDRIYLFFVILCFFSVQGLFINGFSSIPSIRADLRSLLWFFGGIAFFFVLVKTGNVKLNLQILIGLTTFLLIVSMFASKGWQQASIIGVAYSSRISHPSVFLFMAFIFTPLILLFSSDNNTFESKILSICAIGAILFGGVYLAVCRSMLILSVILFVLYCLSFSFENNGIYVNKIRKQKGMFLLLIVSSIGIYLFIALSSKETRLGHLSDFSLMSIVYGNRYPEIMAFFQQYSNSVLIVFGSGLGGTVESPINLLEDTRTMHVGILNFWMKMGMIPFTLVTGFLFIIIPYLYLKTLRNPAMFPPFKRTANLVVLPSLLPWVASLGMSGGFSESNFLFAGFAYLLYGEICHNGLGRILKRETSRNISVYGVKEPALFTWGGQQ